MIARLTALSVVALATLALGCSEEPRRVAAPPPPAPAAAAATPTATPAAATARVVREAPAELVLDADARVAVSAPMPARIVEVHVRPGDHVAGGAPLVTLVLPDAAIEAARAEGASDQLATLEARRTAVAALLADGMARASDLAELDARLAALRAERQVSVATLRAAGLSDPAAVARAAGRLTLRAPAAAVVVDVAAVRGEARAPGDGALVRLSAGEGRRVVARWATSPGLAPATLVLADGTRRALTVAAAAPSADDAAIAIWYDVAGPALPATARGRVIVEAAP